MPSIERETTLTMSSEQEKFGGMFYWIGVDSGETANDFLYYSQQYSQPKDIY